MNMKSVEMQIAIPRTNEAGRVQHEAQHRPYTDQTLLSMQNIKQDEIEKRRSSDVNESAKNTTIRREGNPSFTGEQGHSSAEEHKEEREAEHRAEHPYKGHHIDLSL